MVNSPPVSVGVGIKKALFSVFLVVNILKFDINCTFFLGLFSTYQAKNQKEDLGAFAPNPTHLRGRRGMWQNLSTFPWAECWVDSKASRVKCTTASPLTLSISLGVAKRSEADGAGNLSRLAKNRVAAWPLLVGGDPTLCGWGAGLSRRRRLHPCHVANAGVGSAHGLTSPLGGA